MCNMNFSSHTLYQQPNLHTNTSRHKCHVFLAAERISHPFLPTQSSQQLTEIDGRKATLTCMSVKRALYWCVLLTTELILTFLNTNLILTAAHRNRRHQKQRWRTRYGACSDVPSRGERERQTERKRERERREREKEKQNESEKERKRERECVFVCVWVCVCVCVCVCV